MVKLALAVGAVALSLLAWPSDDVRTVTIRIEHSKFVPSVVDVDAGEEVRFVISNDDPIDHEFIVGDDAVQLRHERGTENRHGDKPGEISIPALQDASTTYVFDQPGTLVFACHLPSHFDYGMRGLIRVN